LGAHGLRGFGGKIDRRRSGVDKQRQLVTVDGERAPSAADRYPTAEGRTSRAPCQSITKIPGEPSRAKAAASRPRARVFCGSLASTARKARSAIVEPVAIQFDRTGAEPRFEIVGVRRRGRRIGREGLIENDRP